MLARVLRNSALTGAASVTQLAIGLLLVSKTIKFLGNDRAGYLIALQAVLAIGGVMGGLGFGPAATRRVAVLLDVGNTKSARRAAEVISLVATSAGLLIAVLVTVNVDAIVRWSRLGADNSADARAATVFMAAAFAVQQAGSVYASVFTGAQRFGTAALLSTSYALTTNALGLGLVYLSPSLQGLALITLATSVAQLVVNSWIASTILGGLVLPRWHWTEFRILWRFAGWAYVGSLGSLLVSQLDRVLITSLLGSGAVPIYAVPQRLVQSCHGIMADQTSVIFPMLSGTAERQIPLIERISDRIRWLTASAAVFAYGGLTIIGPALLAWLISPQFAAESRVLFYCAMLQGVFGALRIVPYYLSWTLGDARPNTVAVSVQGVVSLALMVLLIPHFGVLGAALSQLAIIPVAIGNALWVGRMIRKRVSTPSGVAQLSAYRAPGAAFLVFGIAALSRPAQTNLAAEIIRLMVTTAVAAFAWWVIETLTGRALRRVDLLRDVLALLRQKAKLMRVRSSAGECAPTS